MRTNSMIRKCVWLVVAACIGTTVLWVVSKLSVPYVFDDAYMYARYAHNILAHGKVSWTPQGDATYGLTSILFLGVILPIRLFITDNPLMTVRLSSLLCGFLFLALLAILLEKHTDPSILHRRTAILFLLFSLASSAKPLSTHFVSGMGTTFALMFVTAYLLLSKWHERVPSAASTILVGVCGGLAFSARPDLMLYSIVIPIAMLLLCSDRQAKQNAFAVLIITLLVILLQLWFYHQYFDSFLPLPFFAKGRRLYGSFIHEQYRLVPIKQLLYYASSHRYLFLVIGASFIIGARGWIGRKSAVNTGIVIATILYILYYLFFVLQIMYYDQRFYYPTLPAIVWTASQSVVSLVKQLPKSAKQTALRLLRGVPNSYCLLLVTLALLASLYPVALEAFGSLKNHISQSYFAKYTVLDHYSLMEDVWFGLDEFSALPNDLTIATTEVGLPAAMNPEKTIVDLTGLNENGLRSPGFLGRLALSEIQARLDLHATPSLSGDYGADIQTFLFHGEL